MPQLDQFAFLSHASSIYLIISVMTLFLIYQTMPKIFSILRLRIRLVSDQHPGLSKISPLAVWARKRQWVGTLCNMREVRLFSKFNSTQFWNLQSILRLLYHPYWKNLGVNSPDSNIIISNLYAIRIRYLLYLVKIGPQNARIHYREALKTSALYEPKTELFDLQSEYWKTYFGNNIRIKSYNQASYCTTLRYYDRLHISAANLADENLVNLRLLSNTSSTILNMLRRKIINVDF